MDYEVIPNILEKDWESIEQKIELVRPFAKTIHIDIIDGDFAPNFTFLDPRPFEKYSKDIFFEVHMMVEEPIQYVKKWAECGFKRFLAQMEEMSDQSEFLRVAKEYGEAGLAIDGPTPVNLIKVPLEDLDCVLVYTSDRVGFSGPPFLPDRLDKIREIRSKNPTIPITVDGGINDQTIVLAKDAGANRFGATSFLFKGNPQEQYKKLQEAIS
ncbi:MAG: hypothetical protein M1450_04270 [Patescibacteria group bacterium]|nr:hypothetical protein [Patescibacteria group bacterium]